MKKFLSFAFVWLTVPSASIPAASAQTWLDEPVRIIVGDPPGASTQASGEYIRADAAKFGRIAKAGDIHAK
jgi:hypothetical protein